MKKTLIALLALGSMASATGFMDFADYLTPTTSSVVYESTDVLSQAANFSVTLALDVDKLHTQLVTTGTTHANAPIINVLLNGSSGKEIVSCIYTSSSATTASLWTSLNGNQGRTNMSGNNTSYLSDADWKDATAASLTFTSSKTDGVKTYLTIYTGEKDNLTELVSYTATDSGLKFGTTTGIDTLALDSTGIMQRAYVYNTVLTAQEVAIINKAASAAPEPATATLSLLALAGLASRRRRH